MLLCDESMIEIYQDDLMGAAIIFSEPWRARPGPANARALNVASREPLDGIDDLNLES